MARQARHPLDNGTYHVQNRGNCRMDLFEKADDFQSFIKLLEEGRQRSSMRILGYCLKDNHWHLILRPRQGFAAWGARRAGRGRIGLLCGAMMLGAGDTVERERGVFLPATCRLVKAVSCHRSPKGGLRG